MDIAAAIVVLGFMRLMLQLAGFNLQGEIHWDAGIFHGRFLRSYGFWLQNHATRRNAVRMLICRIT